MDPNELGFKNEKSERLTWEDFFGSSTDLLPTLLSMYESLITTTEVISSNPKIKTGWDGPTTLEVVASKDEEKAGNPNLATRPSSITLNASLNSPVNNDPNNKGYNSQDAVYYSKDSTYPQFMPRLSGRPLSINSIMSSSSSSSGASTYTTSSSSCGSNGTGGYSSLDGSGMLPPCGIAPKASPEDCTPSAPLTEELSDEEEYSRPCANNVSTKEINGRAHNPAPGANPKSTKEEEEVEEDEVGEVRSRAHHRISYPMGGQMKPKFCDPNLSYMDRVLMEIVETEGLYVNDLREIITGYLEFWKKFPLECLSMEDVQQLFSNIEEIYEFNSKFLRNLEECGMDAVKVAECFVENNEGFSIYSEYCTNYPRTMSMLSEMMRQEELVRRFKERQIALGHFLPLGSYLLKPVQRILKYHLLLQNIVKHHEEEEVGHEMIVDALSTMTNIAHHINDMKRKHEHAVRVQEIQSLLYGWQGEDLTTYGELCAEGAFRVCGAKALRHVFLFDKILLITKKKEDGILCYKSHIMCSNLMLIESIPGEPLSFHVIPFDNPRLQCTLQSKNMDQKRGWTWQLKRVILENYNAVIPSHARQLVMELGQNRPEDEASMLEKVATKRQHSAPEYLEKRKLEKERRKSEGNSLKSRLRRSRKGETPSPKEMLGGTKRTSRAPRLWMDRTRERSESGDREKIVGIDRKMSSASCPPSSAVSFTEKRLVKKLSGWRRKSEPGYYKNDCCQAEVTLDERLEPPESMISLESADSVLHEEIIVADEEEESVKEEEQKRSEPAESIEEIVGKIIMENREFQRIMSKKRLVHLRRALRRTAREEKEEDSCSHDNMSSESNGLGDSISDIANNSAESIHEEEEEGCLEPLDHIVTKNVQRTVSDPGNKTLRRFNSNSTQYDPINILWNSFRKSVKQSKAVEEEERGDKRNIRHTHSFTCSKPENYEKGGNTMKSVHGDSGVFANSYSDSSNSSSEANIPTLPAVWLSQQDEHLATPSHKSGSLPRSFQVGLLTSETSCDGCEKSPHVIAKDTQHRPFTIASDKPSPSELPEFEVMENYAEEIGRKKGSNVREIEGSSEAELEIGMHPDHKIYYKSSGKSSSIKSLLLNMSQRLQAIKLNMLSTAGNSLIEEGSSRKKVGNSFLMGKNRRSLKQRIRGAKRENSIDSDSENCESISSGITSGSSTMGDASCRAIGARLAGSDEFSDYALISRCGSNASLSISRDQGMDDQSCCSSSSNETRQKLNDLILNFMDLERNAKGQGLGQELDVAEMAAELDSESTDSFYEQSFEAIENLLEAEMMSGDSAIFSSSERDEENASLSYPLSEISDSSTFDGKYKSETITELAARITSAMNAVEDSRRKQQELKRSSRLVRSQAILEKLRHLEECSRFEKDIHQSPSFEGIKSIQERRKELDMWRTNNGKGEDESETSSQNSTSTINTVIELSPSKGSCGSRRSSDSDSMSSSTEGSSSPVTERSVPLCLDKSKGCKDMEHPNEVVPNKGWVKTVVGRIQAHEAQVIKD